METTFSKEAMAFVKEWAPIRSALNHRPFNPDNKEYISFRQKAENDRLAFLKKWKASSRALPRLA